MAIWKCACGNVREGINYSRVCLAHDVIMIGPGNAGPYPDCKGKLVEAGVGNGDGENVESAERFIARIAKKVEEGDTVVLSRGRSTVLGVGELVEKYKYNHTFGDGTFPEIGDWDISHCWRVRWLWEGHQEFSSNPMGTTRFERLWAPEVLRWLKTLTFDESAKNRPLRELPA